MAIVSGGTAMIRLAVVILATALVVTAADALYDGRVGPASCIISEEPDPVTTGTVDSTRRGCETTVTAPIAVDGPWISEC
jgi:hypothetical protein